MAGHRRTISREGSVTHTEEEWDAHKELFRKCYIDDNLSLKQATAYMMNTYNFFATERQWERRKEQWGFSKYEKRETRQQFINKSLDAGMEYEDIINAPDIPVDESKGQYDRQARRNWRRYVKREREHASRSRSRSPMPPRRSMDEPAQSIEGFNARRHSDHQMIEATYNVGLPNDVVVDQMTGTLPDTIMLEATQAQNSPQTPIQLHVLSEVNPTAEQVSAPYISISLWDDSSSQLQPHQQFDSMFDASFEGPQAPENYSLPLTDMANSGDRGLDGSYVEYSQYPENQTGQDFGASSAYNPEQTSLWSEGTSENTPYNPNQPEFFVNPGDVSGMNEPFPQIRDGEGQQVQFDNIFNVEPSPQSPIPDPPSMQIHPRVDSITSRSIVQAPLTSDLWGVVEQYTLDVQSAVKDILDGPNNVHPKVAQENLQRKLEHRRNACIQTMSKYILNDAQAKQRAIDSTTEKCRLLERIMAEKGIDTRAELKAARLRKQQTRNDPFDMTHFDLPTNTIP